MLVGDSLFVPLSWTKFVLYPSLDIDFSAQIVSEMFQYSDVKLDGVDVEELGLYLALRLILRNFKRKT